jgi:DNA-directed RNA polymerase specialized sigma24 family protein
MRTAIQRAPRFPRSTSARSRESGERAAFEAFFEPCFARVYAFAAAHAPTPRAAEAITRATLASAVRAGLVGASSDVAPRLLAIAKEERARLQAERATDGPRLALTRS